MKQIRSDVIGGFNSLLEDQRQESGPCTLTLVQFDTQDTQEVLYDFEPLERVPELTEAKFRPRGGTPLLDAIGTLIDTTGQRLAEMAEPERPGKVIVVIMTDGLENSSHRYSREQVFERIRQQRETYRWQFIFQGADQDAIAVASSFGIDPKKSMSFSSNHDSTALSMSSSSGLMSRIRRAKDAEDAEASSFDPDEIRRQEDLRRSSDLDSDPSDTNHHRL
jgi:uncharacterized protein YegL